MINKINSRMDIEDFGYRNELQDLPMIVKEEDWTETNQTKFRRYFLKKDELTAFEGKVFFEGSRYIPENQLIDRILHEANSLHLGIKRTRK